MQNGPGLHLDDRERLAVVEVEVGAVLQERRLDRDRALVVQAGAEAQVGGEVVDAERVVEPVGRVRVLVVDDASRASRRRRRRSASPPCRARRRRAARALSTATSRRMLYAATPSG